MDKLNTSLLLDLVIAPLEVLVVEEPGEEDKEGDHVHDHGVLHPHGEVAADDDGVDTHHQREHELQHLKVGDNESLKVEAA